VEELKKLSVLLFFTAIVLHGLTLTKPSFADVPQIRNVVVWKDGVITMLNVTVYHNQEIVSHRVDSLTVTINSNTLSFPQNTPNVLDPATSTFYVSLNIGSVTGTPSATVLAHCNLHGNSSQNWAGTIPEFPLTALTLLAAATASLVFILLRKSIGLSKRAIDRSKPKKASKNS